MKIKNKTPDLVAFMVTMPSSNKTRLLLPGGETSEISDAFRVALVDHAYFASLVEADKLEIVEGEIPVIEGADDEDGEG